MSITPESVQQLLNSEDLGERLRAINQIRDLDAPVAFQLLKTGVQDKNPRVRYAAVSQLATVGSEDPTESLEILRDRLLHDPEIDVQAAAADALGALNLKEAFEDLKQVYEHTSEWILRISIIATLATTRDPRAFPLLIDALGSDNELLQTVAISALGEFGDPQAIELLLPFTQNSDWQIRYRVAQALGELGGPQAQGALDALAGDNMEIVANEAKRLQGL